MHGAALVLTLWLVALGTILAFHYARAVRVDTQVAAASLDRQRARAAAEAGLWQSVFEISSGESEDVWPIDGSPVEWEYDVARLEVSVQDVSGLADLNTVQEDTLAEIIEYVLDDPERAPGIVARILDWRDRDHERRPEGAEDADYAAAEISYGAKDGPFNTREELQLVLGVTLEDYRRIAPFVTVFSQKQGINTAVAPIHVMNALGQAPAAEEVSSEPDPKDQTRKSGPRGGTLEILAEATVGGSVSRIAATIDVKPNRRRGAEFAILNWSENWPIERRKEDIDEQPPSS